MSSFPSSVTVSGEQSVIVDEDIVLVCVSLGDETLTYQWKKGGTNVGNGGDTLTISNAVTSDSGNYTCLVSNSYGTAISANYPVLVQEVPVINSETPPDTTPTLNAMIDFVVTASGTAPLTYEWQFSVDDDSYAVVSNGGTTSGADEATMALQAVTQAQGYYRCRVYNAVGEAISSAMDIQMSPPAITTEPEGIGSGGTATVVAEGVGTLTYQWLYGGVSISGQVSEILTVDPASVDLLRGYKFSCRVSNDYGSVTSEEVSCRPFLHGADSGGGNCQRATGVQVKLVAGIVGPPGTSYSWEKNGVACGGDVDVFGDSVPTLTIKEPQMADDGTYVCRGSNALGYVDSDEIEVTMQDNESVHKLPRTTPDLRVFDDETLETEIVALMPSIQQACNVGCEYQTYITYRWDGAIVPYVNAEPVYTGLQGDFVRRGNFSVDPSTNLIAVSDEMFKTMEVTLDGSTIPTQAYWSFILRKQYGSEIPNTDPTQYYVPSGSAWSGLDVSGLVTSRVGIYGMDYSDSITSFTSNVITKAAITDFTDGPLVFVIGDDLSIDVAANGDNLQYAWYRDGVRCPLQSDPNFSKNATCEDSGNYTAKVGNESYMTRHAVESSGCVVEIIGMKETPGSFIGVSGSTVTGVFCGNPDHVEFALLVTGSTGAFQDSPVLTIGNNFEVPLKIRIRHKTQTNKFHDAGEFTVTEA